LEKKFVIKCISNGLPSVKKRFIILDFYTTQVLQAVCASLACCRRGLLHGHRSYVNSECCDDKNHGHHHKYIFPSLTQTTIANQTALKIFKIEQQVIEPISPLGRRSHHI